MRNGTGTNRRFHLKTFLFILAIFPAVAYAQATNPVPSEALVVPIWLSIVMPFLIAFLTSFLQDRETYRAAKAKDPTVEFDWSLACSPPAVALGAGASSPPEGIRCPQTRYPTTDAPQSRRD